MAVKILYINSGKIQNEQYQRFDVKYYIVDNFFASLSNKQKFVVATLSNLKDQIISGSYIDTYTTKKEGIPYLRVGDMVLNRNI